VLRFWRDTATSMLEQQASRIVADIIKAVEKQERISATLRQRERNGRLCCHSFEQQVRMYLLVPLLSFYPFRVIGGSPGGDRVVCLRPTMRVGRLCMTNGVANFKPDQQSLPFASKATSTKP
jgi:hypothetical protein